MTFFYLQNYSLLLMLPLLWYTWSLYKRKKAFLLQIYTLQFLQHYNIQRGFLFKYILINSMALGILLYILYPAGKVNNTAVTQEAQNTDTYIHFILDVSLSMYVHETDDTRIAKAIALIKNTVKNTAKTTVQTTADNNTQFALSVFTDTLVQVIPFTSDTAFLFNTLDSIMKAPLIQGSSDIAQLFYQMEQRSAEGLFPAHGNVVILSDWESHTKVNALRFRTLTEYYDTIFCVFVGSETAQIVRTIEGVPIRNTEGNVAYSTAQPTVAKEIAQTLNAEYVEAQQSLTVPTASKATVQYDFVSWLISFCVAIVLLGYILLEN